jgi:hypothetical protein
VIFCGQSSVQFLATFFLISFLVSVLVFARELWWMNQNEKNSYGDAKYKMVAVRGTRCTIPPRNSNQFASTYKICIIDIILKLTMYTATANHSLIKVGTYKRTRTSPTSVQCARITKNLKNANKNSDYIIQNIHSHVSV